MKKLSRRLFQPALIILCLALSACAATSVQAPPGPPALSAWPEADRLFYRDPCWLGGDGASSVPLSDDRMLWLFGDSFVCEECPCTRETATIVRNSIAVLLGRDPARDRPLFSWGEEQGKPAAFFKSPRPGEWLWPASALGLDEKILVFFYRVKEEDNALGFAPCGHMAALLEETEGPASGWKAAYVDIPENGFGALLGAACLAEGEWVYAYGLGKGPDAPVFLARWPRADWTAKAPGEPSWWAGPEKGYVAQSRLGGNPQPVMRGGQNEFFVGRSKSGGFFCVQSIGFGATDVGWRSATDPAGPWSGPEALFSPQEKGIPRVLIYAAKAHPGLSGGDMVLTYVVNSLDFEALYREKALYRPRFLRSVGGQSP